MSIAMLKGVHRRTLGISHDDKVMAREGFIAGGDGKPAIVFPSPDTVAVFDDFLGDLVADEWNVVEGDTGNSGAIVAGVNGVLRLQLSLTGTMTPAGGVGINGGALQWKANQGPTPYSGALRMGARIKTGLHTDFGSMFVGFTDNTAAEAPIYDTGGAIISPAADAVGFIWGPRGDTGFMAVSAKSTAGDSGDQQATTGIEPVAGQYTTLEVEISRGINDTGGRATFFVNGQAKATINSPINTGVALTPAIWISGLATDTGNRLDIDWMNVSAPRDTGT